MYCLSPAFNNMMDLSRCRFVLVVISFHAVLYFSKFGGVYAQHVFFPRSVLQLAKASFCNCIRSCLPGDLEPELMCFSACECATSVADIRNKAPAKCDPYHEDCFCPRPPERRCPMDARQVCTFEDGVICEYERKYCVDHNDQFTPSCSCKDGWSGPECRTCDNCNNGAALFNNTAALVLGSLLSVVVLVLIFVIIVYWRLGRLPCQKRTLANMKGDAKKTAMGNAYSVSGPMPITGQDGSNGKRPVISPLDADTGEMENEYAYAAINEYATIAARDSVRPAVPTAPVPSVSAAKTGEAGAYYFKLANDEQKPGDDTTPTTSTSTKTTTGDCYTKVIRKPKEDKPKPPISQYDRLDRTNIRPPPNGDNGSPSDNEYGTLASSMANEDSENLSSENSDQNLA